MTGASLEMAVMLLGHQSFPSRPLSHTPGFMLTLDLPGPAHPSRVDERALGWKSKKWVDARGLAHEESYGAGPGDLCGLPLVDVEWDSHSACSATIAVV